MPLLAGPGEPTRSGTALGEGWPERTGI